VSEDMDSYLWNGKGEPDENVASLEELLLPLRYTPQTLVLAPQRRLQSRSWIFWMTPAAGVAALILFCLGFNQWRLHWTADKPWPVQVVSGRPSINGLPLVRSGRLGIGQVLQTDSSSSAEMRVARIGTLEVAPNTQLLLVATRMHQHKIALRRGQISARIWAPPWSLSMETPSAMAFDLGCAFTLEVKPDGAGSVRVTSGWVQLESEGLQTLVPAGAQAETRNGFAPGSPYFQDATPEFKRALRMLNFEKLDSRTYQLALQTVLLQARTRDVLTLLNFLPRTNPEQRAIIYDRAAQLAPPPVAVTRDGIVNGNQLMLDEWWDSLGYRNAKTWWLNWKDGVFF
jgi:FecR protein